MSEAFTEILGTAERAAAGSEDDKNALVQLLDGIDVAALGTPEDRAYLAVLLDWIGMRERAMLALRPEGGEHSGQGAEMPNLAGMLASGHGEYGRARELFAQALSVVNDETHLQVKILANLAALSLLAGESGSASRWLTQARSTRVQAGDPATDVLMASAEFGIARTKGSPAGMGTAVSRLHEATRARIAELGSNHPLALTAVASLAAAEFELASAQESIENQERSIAVLEVVAHRLAADLGADHPQALACLENLCVADFCLARATTTTPERASRAASALESVSRRTSAVLGEDHPQARAAAENAASARRELERGQQADSAPRRAIPLFGSFQDEMTSSDGVSGRLNQLGHPARIGLVQGGDRLSVSTQEVSRALAGLSTWTATRTQGAAAADPARIAGELAEAEAQLVALAQVAARDRTAIDVVGMMHLRCAMLLFDLAKARGKTPDVLARMRTHLDQIPEGLGRRFPPIASAKAMLGFYLLDVPVPTAELAVASVRDAWDIGDQEIARAEAAAARASATGDRDDILAAIEESRRAWIGLTSRSPQRGWVLNLLADMQLTLAVVTKDLSVLADAQATTVAALRATTTPRAAQAAACTLLDCLTVLAILGLPRGPLSEAEAELRRSLDYAEAGTAERAAVLAATGAVIGMRAAALDDEPLRQASRQLIKDAESALPAAAPSARQDGTAWTLYDRTAYVLHRWTMVQAFVLGDAEILPAALRVVDKVERSLAEGTPSAERRKAIEQARRRLTQAQRRSARGQPIVSRAARASARSEATLWNAEPDDQFDAEQAAMLAQQAIEQATFLRSRAQFDPDELASIVSRLDQVLAPSLGDTGTRHQVHVVLGLSLADLAAVSPDAQSEQLLGAAITHLSQGLATGDYSLPTWDRAYLLDALASCYRKMGVRNHDAGSRNWAESAVRAALRELRACVLVADSAGQALEAASKASRIAARAVGWLLADGREQAAISIAEAGRGLVLASVTLAGRAEEILRGAGENAAADAWIAGTAAARAEALDVLTEISAGASLLATPTAATISAGVAATHLDAVAYLVPPDETSDFLGGHAVLVRSATPMVEVVPLPGLGVLQGIVPLKEYLAAQDAAFGSGLPGLPEREAWVRALDDLGRWAYETVMGPLIVHTRDWRLDHLPRLALIPLGMLGAIPFAAAWTMAEGGTGTRRYAIEDLVLSYEASAHLLGEVASRPRQPIDERVVFVTDPTGQFHLSRRVLHDLVSRLYPGAEVYGLRHAPNGPATTAVVLDALPGGTQRGASLLHLTTHVTLAPEPTMTMRDGTLALASILQQARGRASGAPGGLVITNACLTDVALTDYDESLTLATAFLAVGAVAVIGTRWPVEEDTATALAVRLHHHLKDGAAPAEALRRAQVDLLRLDPAVRESLGPRFDAVDDSRLSHPASWAGHVHHGI